VKRKSRVQQGFSLGEMLATVIIGSMVLVAILSIYGRANQAANAVLAKVESPALASEVLQLIARDLDRTLGADDMVVQIRNGLDHGFARAELVLRRVYHDKDNKEQVLDEITWRAAYDSGGDTPGLVIYRSREGTGREDRLLEDQREDWEKNYPFVPICRGVTFFQVQACKGEELVDKWPLSTAPAGVKVTISFAKSYETLSGARDVPEEDKISRTLVLNAMRKIKFAMDSAGDVNQPDANEPVPETQEASQDESKTTEQATTTRTQSPRRSVTNGRISTQKARGR
jgi:type II secretory pathway pseudopilin PulG